MLSTLRRAAKTKVASVVIGCLVMAFALWGVNDIFRGVIPNVVAEVGDTQIPGAEFDREFRLRLRAMTPPGMDELTVEQGRAMGLDQATLDAMISRAAIDATVDRLALTASDETVATHIRSLPEFRGADGGFNPANFQQALRNMGFTEPQYVESTRHDITRAQLLNSVASGVVPPPGLTRLFHDLINETRTPESVVLTPADAGAIPAPTEMDLANFHRAHPELFSAPEYRALDYVELGPDQVADKVEVTEDDLKNEYATQRATYETPEQREIEQISFPDKEAADAAAARLTSGTSFAAIAQERGLKDEDYKLGTLPATGLDARLSAVAFATPEGGVTAPVQGPFGWVILRVPKVVPGSSKSLEEMLDTLRTSLTRARAAVHVQDLVNALEDERATGASLADAAMKLGLTVKRVAAVDMAGMTPEGTKADVPAQPAFLEQAFALESGDESDPFRTDEDHNYVMRINGVTPTALKPIDQVRDQVRQGWEAQTRLEALKRKAETIATEARSGNFADATRSLGRRPTAGMPIRRDQPSDVLSEQLKQQFFGEPKGAIIVGPAPSGANYVVVRVADIQHPPVDTASDEYAQFRSALSQQLAGDIVEAMAATARADAGVTTHPEVIQTILGDVPQ